MSLMNSSSLNRHNEINIKEQKDVSLELLRIIACFFVIFNHTAKHGFFLFSLYSNHSLQYWLYLFIAVFCKFAVPMFFAISGALLLKKKESIKELYSKRVVRILSALILFSFFYYLIQVYRGKVVFSISNFFIRLYSDKWNFSFWYLYTFLAFLISLPLLRPMVNHMKNQHFLYLFVWAIIIKGVLPILEYRFSQGAVTLNKNVEWSWLVSYAVLFPPMGYYIFRRLDVERIQKKHLIALWLINLFLLGLVCYMTNYLVSVTGVCSEDKSQVFFKSFSVVNMTTVFITVRYFCHKIVFHERISRWIIYFGRATFGIYLVHVAILDVFNYKLRINGLLLWDIFKDKFHFNPMLTAWLIVLMILCLGAAVTEFLKRIPLLNQIL